MTPRLPILASLLLCAFALNAGYCGQRAAQVFDGVKMSMSPIALPSDFVNTEPVSYEPIPLLPAPAPHVVTLEWFQPGNVLKHVVEEAPTPAGPWEFVLVRWNEYVAADTTFRVTFTSQRNPAFWRVFASNQP